VLEAILQAVRCEQERTSVERAVADYYTSLSVQEVMDHADWGAFGLHEFPNEERA